MKGPRAILLLLPLLVSTAGGAVSRDVTSLPWQRTLQLPEDVAPGSWIEVREDRILAEGAAPGFGDVRIVDDAGQLVPVAVIEPRLHDTRFRRRTGYAIPWVMVPARHWEGVLDLGSRRSRTLLLDFPGPEGERIRLLTGLDGNHWTPVVVRRMEFMPEPPEPGARFRIGIEPPDRYLKLIAEGFTGRTSLPDSLEIVEVETLDAPREPVPFGIEGAKFSGRTWEATIVVEGPARAIAALVLEVPRPTPAGFPIRVEAELPRGGRRWLRPEREPNWTSTAVDTLVMVPMRTRSLRIEVENADPPNPPFTIRQVEVVPQRWMFPPPPAGDVRLAYGDPYLEARRWGMESAAAWEPTFVLASLAAPEPNPSYAPPGPGLEWLRRHPPVVGVIMVFLLLLVGLVILRGGRKETA